MSSIDREIEDTKDGGWPFNKNAVGFIVGMIAVVAAAFSDSTPFAILGACVCALWCTSQICDTIKGNRR